MWECMCVQVPEENTGPPQEQCDPLSFQTWAGFGFKKYLSSPHAPPHPPNVQE